MNSHNYGQLTWCVERLLVIKLHTIHFYLIKALIGLNIEKHNFSFKILVSTILLNPLLPNLTMKIIVYHGHYTIFLDSDFYNIKSHFLLPFLHEKPGENQKYKAKLLSL